MDCLVGSKKEKEKANVICEPTGTITFGVRK